jgi:hypothetical protein
VKSRGSSCHSGRGGEWPDAGLAGVGVAPGVDGVQAGERAGRFSYARSEETVLVRSNLYVFIQARVLSEAPGPSGDHP